MNAVLVEIVEAFLDIQAGHRRASLQIERLERRPRPMPLRQAILPTFRHHGENAARTAKEFDLHAATLSLAKAERNEKGGPVTGAALPYLKAEA